MRVGLRTQAPPASRLAAVGWPATWLAAWLVAWLAAGLAAGLVAAPASAQDATGAAADTARTPEAADAYLDERARELVRRARERRRVVDRSIEAYETTASERFSLGLRAVRRERILWEREVASRVSWEREGPVRIEVLGAREVLPMLIPEAQVPRDVAVSMPHLAFDPADPYLLTGWGDGNARIGHPLAPGSERDYRFRSGGTTVIRLPDGREVRLLELEVLPRRRAGDLIQGSFWLHEDTHAVVQLTFRLAGDFDLDRGGGFPLIFRPAVARLEYVTIEYGLWDLQWWLPRIFAVRGAATLGRAVSVPLLYERRYTGYEVRGMPGGVEELAVEDSEYASGTRVRCPSRFAVVVQPTGSGEAEEELDRQEAAARDSARVERQRQRLSDAERAACDRIEVVVPADRSVLLTSPALSADAFAGGVGLLSDAELSAIRSQLARLAPTPWQTPRARFSWPANDPDLARYNRVEGLSLGARGELDLGPVQSAATVRLGLADLEPNGELAVSRDGMASTLRLAGYRRLVTMDPEPRPFSYAASLSSLVFARDERDYYRTLGIEIAGEPTPARSRWYDWRVYAQRERPAAKETDFSLPRIFDGDRAFPDNAPADHATQYGVAVRLRGAWGHDPQRLRLSGELALDGAAGTFDHARAALTLRAGVPLPRSLVGLVEAAGGSTLGQPGFQHLWRVGGTSTLRGYPIGALAGETFWRARAELAAGPPAVRLALFSDAGWAGPADRLGSDPWLLSAGIGLSFLDGLFRLDLAHRLRTPTGWRLSGHMDAWQ